MKKKRVHQDPLTNNKEGQKGIDKDGLFSYCLSQGDIQDHH